jgi:hypothetical protein
MKQKDELNADKEAKETQQRAVEIRGHVMHALGNPGNLHSVQVRPLWEGHYRVNVFVGLDAASAKVAHSYFLVTDDNGNIVASTPKIGKRY